MEGGERASDTVFDCFYRTRNITAHCFRNCVCARTHGSSDVSSLSNSGEIWNWRQRLDVVRKGRDEGQNQGPKNWREISLNDA